MTGLGKKLTIENNIYMGSLNEEIINEYYVMLYDDTKRSPEMSLGCFSSKKEAMDFCIYYLKTKEADVVYDL